MRSGVAAFQGFAMRARLVIGGPLHLTNLILRQQRYGACGESFLISLTLTDVIGLCREQKDVVLLESPSEQGKSRAHLFEEETVEANQKYEVPFSGS